MRGGSIATSRFWGENRLDMPVVSAVHACLVAHLSLGASALCLGILGPWPTELVYHISAEIAVPPLPSAYSILLAPNPAQSWAPLSPSIKLRDTAIFGDSARLLSPARDFHCGSGGTGQTWGAPQTGVLRS